MFLCGSEIKNIFERFLAELQSIFLFSQYSFRISYLVFIPLFGEAYAMHTRPKPWNAQKFQPIVRQERGRRTACLENLTQPPPPPIACVSVLDGKYA